VRRGGGRGVSANTQAWARRYIERGRAPIPVPPSSKNPNRPGWQNERLTLEDVPHFFDNGQNVGLLNGNPSGWAVCAECDVTEAAKLVGRFKCLRSPPAARAAHIFTGG
jgi:hypothetical protein